MLFAIDILCKHADVSREELLHYWDFEAGELFLVAR